MFVFQGDLYVGLHAATVADVEDIHVLRKAAVVIALPGLAAMQRTKEILCPIDDITLSHSLVSFNCSLTMRENHPTCTCTCEKGTRE